MRRNPGAPECMHANGILRMGLDGTTMWVECAECGLKGPAMSSLTRAYDGWKKDVIDWHPKLKDMADKVHGDAVKGMEEAYALVQHIYNVMGTGFDRLSSDEIGKLGKDARTASYRLIKAAELIDRSEELRVEAEASMFEAVDPVAP